MAFANPSLPRDGGFRGARRRSLMARLTDRAFPALQSGGLQLELPNGDIIERNGGGEGPHAVLRVNRWRALRRMLADGEYGFSEAYLDDDWATPALHDLLELFTRNDAMLRRHVQSSMTSVLWNQLLHLLRSNTRRGSRRNIAAHYDLGNEFFSCWLDAGMNYSSALYTGDSTLQAAQDAKLARVAALLDLSGGESVLEIGCGWGALAERLVRCFNAAVCGITLSAEQLQYARTRLAGEIDEGLADLRLLDYRDIVGKFDRIVSIEMIEAVGEHYWPAYFAKLRACLRKRGVAVLQAITIAEDRFAAYRRRPDFIQRHIFPGGMLPTCRIISSHAARAGLVLVHHESFGSSYARTLREWRIRFSKAWPTIERLGFDERFRRMWEYYLAYCEIGFCTGRIDVGFFKLQDDSA